MYMRISCPICSSSVCEQVFSVTISQRSDSTMDGELNIMKCAPCSFFFTNSKSVEGDYNNYYSTHNNYAGSQIVWEDRNAKTADFLVANLDPSIKTIIDYGSGDGAISKKLSSKFSVTNYDIGQEEPNGEYDCLVLSHVLEHIYNPKAFIELISRYVRDDGFLYIEIPDASQYHNIGDFGILQELNIEHINFFSPYALSKIMVQANFTPVSLKQGVCLQRGVAYPVIYSIFRKMPSSTSVERYIREGSEQLETLKNALPELKGRVFVYGCGQFTYKIIKHLQSKYDIECIIDDNPNFKDKTLNSLRVVPLVSVQDTLRSSDNVIIVAGSVYISIIRNKLNSVCSGLNIVTF